jgi:hypothetical protein
MELNNEAPKKAGRENLGLATHIMLTCIALAGRNSASEAQESDTSILAASLTYPSCAEFAMRSWPKVLLRSTAGFPIQAGLFFISAMKKT